MLGVRKKLKINEFGVFDEGTRLSGEDEPMIWFFGQHTRLAMPMMAWQFTTTGCLVQTKWPFRN